MSTSEALKSILGVLFRLPDSLAEARMGHFNKVTLAVLLLNDPRSRSTRHLESTQPQIFHLFRRSHLTGDS
jgi:hypothetical protein